MLNKLDQLKTPRERAIEMLNKIIVGELDVKSISIERFKSEDKGKLFLQVCLELTPNV